MNIRERLIDQTGEDELLFCDGFDEAIIGVASGWFPAEKGSGCHNHSVVLYDYEKCVSILMKRDKMTRDGAEEFLGFNTLGGYVGPRTPVFATFLKKQR